MTNNIPHLPDHEGEHQSEQAFGYEVTHTPEEGIKLMTQRIKDLAAEGLKFDDASNPHAMVALAKTNKDLIEARKRLAAYEAQRDDGKST